MTIQDLGSLGELLAAIATFVTLLALAVEIRENTRAMRAASHHTISNSFHKLLVEQGMPRTGPSFARRMVGL